MRYHSVVFQTILSGNNYVLDYTEPNKGKIFGFLKEIDEMNFYEKRYISLQDGDIPADFISLNPGKFKFNKDSVRYSMNIYLDELNNII